MDKNQSVEIQFIGKKNTVFNVVSYDQFERIYKPKGWVLLNKVAEEPKKEESLVDKPTDEIVADLNIKNEQEIKNINATKKKSTTVDKFNDKIIKE